MTMDYGSSGTEMGTAAEQASTASEKQLESVFGVSNAWSRLGITPMIGPNDTPGETFTLADANTVRSFAASKGVRLSVVLGNGQRQLRLYGAAELGHTGMPSRATAAAAVANTVSPAALDPSVAPGGQLQSVPYGSCNCRSARRAPPPRSRPSQLKGAGGFQDSYFYTDSGDGSMTFWDPENGVNNAQF